MKRLTMIALVTALLVTLLAACGESEKAIPGETRETSRPVIGYSIDSLVIERWQRDRDVFVSAANELGFDVWVEDAGGQASVQADQLRYFLDHKVPVVVVIASDCYSLSHVIWELRNAGTKVICYDRLIQGTDIDFYLSFDSEKVGEMMAETMADSIGPGGNLLCVYGSLSDYNSALLKAGVERVLKDREVNLLGAVNAYNWVAETAYDTVNEALEKGQTIDGVLCGNDDIAGYAWKALAEYGMAGEVTLVGQDAELSACQRIVEGTQLMTVYKPVEELARAAAGCAADLYYGREPEKNTDVNNGTMEVPSYLLDPIMVKRDNLEEIIIDSGFHMREDVYLNVQE